MSSTATNKQPLLIDRPLFEQVMIGAVAGLTTSTNWATPGTDCEPLVEGGSEGACVDSVEILTTQASTTTSNVLLFMSTAADKTGINATNTHCVCSAQITAGLGDRVTFELPGINAPVPQIGGVTAPDADDKKNTALYVPKNKVLYVGLDVALCAPNLTCRVIVSAQGGYY